MKTFLCSLQEDLYHEVFDLLDRIQSKHLNLFLFSQEIKTKRRLIEQFVICFKFNCGAIKWITLVDAERLIWVYWTAVNLYTVFTCNI